MSFAIALLSILLSTNCQSDLSCTEAALPRMMIPHDLDNDFKIESVSDITGKW